MKTPVKIPIKNTSLFDPVLKETLLSASEEPLGLLESETVCSLRLDFDEMQIYDKRRVEHLQVPEEALPRYLRGQLLRGIEKYEEAVDFIEQCYKCVFSCHIKSERYHTKKR